MDRFIIDRISIELTTSGCSVVYYDIFNVRHQEEDLVHRDAAIRSAIVYYELVGMV